MLHTEAEHSAEVAIEVEPALGPPGASEHSFFLLVLPSVLPGRSPVLVVVVQLLARLPMVAS